jgi:hypothetical protein
MVDKQVLRDGMGFELVKNPNGQGMMTSALSEAAWEKWKQANPPPNDGYCYETSPLYPEWRRVPCPK